MKKMKRIVALFVATVMCLTLSISVSAAIDKTVNYTIEYKFLDADGNEITTAAPGEDVYLGVYFYQTEGKAAVETASNATARFVYCMGVPFAMLPEYTTAVGADFSANVVTGCKAALANTDEEEYVWIDVDVDITGGLTSTASTPMSKVKFTLPETEGEYEIIVDDIVTSVTDGVNPVSSKTFVNGVITVEEKQGVTPSIDSTTANDQTGVAVLPGKGDFKYDNAYAVSVTLKGVAGMTEAGMEFVPAFVNDWNKAAKATFDGTVLGKGDAEYKAALINIPSKYIGATFGIMARPYYVANGVKTEGDPTTKQFTYTYTGEPQ